jgi:hypothetical protein
VPRTCHWFFRLVLCVGACLSLGTAHADPAYPVKVGPTGRYLVDQNGVPFLMTGESPQAMIGNLSLADAELFLQNRRAHGFNTVLIDLLCATYTGCRAEGTTFDGIPPFLATLGSGTTLNGTTAYDLTLPNPEYFARADAIILLAAQYGFLVLLDPIETGSWLQVLQVNGVTAAREFGQFVGGRYKTVPNILWFHGNDYGPPNFDLDLNDPLVTAVALGIKDVDAMHLHTVLLNTGGSLPSVLSSDDPAWRPIIDINAAYTYHATHQNILDGYNTVPTMPVFMGETGYEFEDFAEFGAAPQALRAQEYWAILSGATGQVYGNKFTWPLRPGSGWQAQLDTPGAVQMAFLTNLFTPRRWYNLVPDQTHTVVTAGYGTFKQQDYVTAAQTPDGALAMAYVPSARTLIVDLATMSGPTTARWYDPTDGSLVAIEGSPFANTGPLAFAPPGANADGDADWVLVLEATVTPALTSISPTQVTVGGPDFTLTVNGKRFDPTSVVRVNGAARPTTFRSVTKLTAVVPASDITVAGTLSITVFTPGAALSNAATLSVRNPVPSLAAIDPTRTLQGSEAFTLIVNGSNFTASAVVRWKGLPRDTNFVSPTELSAEILASDLTTAGTATVTVFTPTPGGGTSATATFTVDAPGRVAFASATATVDETVASVTLPVTRTAGVGGPVTVDYATTDGTAHAGEDYDARSGTLTFGVGVTSQTIVVPIHFTPGGGANETFTVTLGQATSGLVVGTPATTTVTVRNLNATLTSFTPAQGAVGTLVTLTGANLNLATAVSFGGVNTSAIAVLSPTSIRVAVPSGAVTGPVAVTSPAGNPTSVALFKVLPKITGLTPDDGLVDSTVTIIGTNLTGVTAVRFGAALANFSAGNDSALTATVPAAAVTGTVSVTTPGGTATSPAPFVVIRAPTITSFTPTIAPEGALVTLNGANLASVVWVSFHGVNASPVTIVSATSIRAVVPTGATTGRLTASNPAGTATSLADFKVAPRILTMTPAQGAPGTSVVISGTTFTGGTAPTGATGTAATVRFGSIVAGNVSVDNATTITAMVPATAPTGRISVTTPSGTATSATDFTVIRPPTITSFTPLAGPVGTAVTISGANLGSVTSVSLNGVDASPVTVLSPTSVRVIVPLTATTGKIAVANPTGPATSAAVFAVTPAITSLTPARGLPGTSGTPGTGGIPGTSVVIAGSTFDGVTAVRFGSVPATFTGNSSQITVTVPPTAMSGMVSVTTPFGTAVSGTPFTVVRAPVLSILLPARGAVGSTLTLSGANIGTVTTVIFNSSGNGNVSAITVLSASSVRVVVPEGAVTGRIGVTNEAGVATSATDFVLTPRLVSTSPSRAIPGAAVTLTGFNLDGATAVRFGSVVAGNVSVDSPIQITVPVPLTAVTGKVSVTTPAGTTTSATDFIVVRAPTITSFSPVTGPEGTLVTLTGANLAGASSVAFNGANVTALTIVSASSIRVVVPAGVATGKLGVANEAGSALSAGTFTVAPRIVEIPAAGLPAAAVTITGTSLGSASAVRFGGVAAAFTPDGPIQITATVPSSAVSGKITVTTPGGTATSPTDFTVIRPPVVTSFTPASAQVGALVTISGANLGSATAVAFGNVSTTSITVLSASSIRVALPAGATTGRLTVTNPAGSAQSAGTFVLVPRLTGFGAPSGSDDDAVTLVGTGLTGAAVVKFGTVSAAFTVVSDTEITAIVPAAAVTGRVSVTTPGGTALSPTDFVITAPSTS